MRLVAAALKEAGMRQSGEYRIDAPVAAVWRALNDPDVLARCIDGCQSVQRLADDRFEAQVRVKVGPMSALFSAEVTLADLDPPRACTLAAAVKGGPAGFGKGAAQVALEAEGAATVLRYEASGSVGGKLAQIGQRLIDATARKLADDFFTAFTRELAPAEAGPAASAPSAAAKPQRGPSGLWLVLIVGVGVAIVAAILYSR